MSAAASRPESSRLDAAPSADPQPGIRPAGPADLPGVLEVEHASFTSPWPRTAFEMALNSPELLFEVAELNGRPVGHVLAARHGVVALIANLAIAPPQRRLGLGATMLDRAIDWARASGALTCRLEVRVSNRAAIRLYRSRGFEPVGVQDNYYSRPSEPALSMALRLADPS